MDGFKGIIERARLDSIIACLVDGDVVGVRHKEKDYYQERVDTALEHMADRLGREPIHHKRSGRELYLTWTSQKRWPPGRWKRGNTRSSSFTTEC